MRPTDAIRSLLRRCDPQPRLELPRLELTVKRGREGGKPWVSVKAHYGTGVFPIIEGFVDASER
jgi:hypothetical protein